MLHKLDLGVRGHLPRLAHISCAVKPTSCRGTTCAVPPMAYCTGPTADDLYELLFFPSCLASDLNLTPFLTYSTCHLAPLSIPHPFPHDHKTLVGFGVCQKARRHTYGYAHALSKPHNKHVLSLAFLLCELRSWIDGVGYYHTWCCV